MGLLVILAHLGAILVCCVAAQLWSRAADDAATAEDAPGSPAPEEGDHLSADRLNALVAGLRLQARMNARAAGWTTAAVAIQAMAIAIVLLAAGLA